MKNDSKKELNKQILRNLLQEKEYAIASKNYERLEYLEVALKKHMEMIVSEYEKED